MASFQKIDFIFNRQANFIQDSYFNILIEINYNKFKQKYRESNKKNYKKKIIAFSRKWFVDRRH